DDNPNPTDPEVASKLDATRSLATDIGRALRAPHDAAQKALRIFVEGRAGGSQPGELLPLTCEAYEQAALWLEAMAQEETINDHVDEFFVDSVIMGLARELRLTLLALSAAQAQEGSPELD